MSTFTQVGDFCSNTTCADHGKLQSEHQQNIIKFGKTKANRQRFKCKTCGNTFTETKGTIFYRRRTPENEIIETLALIAEGLRSEQRKKRLSRDRRNRPVLAIYHDRHG